MARRNHPKPTNDSDLNFEVQLWAVSNYKNLDNLRRLLFQ